MIPDKDIEQKLERLADCLGTNDLFVSEVMARIEDSSVQRGKTERKNIVLRSILMKRTVKFAAAAVIVAAAFLSLTTLDSTVPNLMASEVLTSAIDAVQNNVTIHIKAMLRTLPADNFSYINPKLDFVPIEMWGKTGADGKPRIRIDKPQRQLAMDGETATMIIGNSYVNQIKTSAYACFNSDWLSLLMNVDELLKTELKFAQDDEKHEISIYHEEIEGQDTLVLKRNSQANVLKGDYLRNKFIEDSERTYYYYFDPQTKLLQGMRLFVHVDGEDVLIFEIKEIVFNSEIDDSHFTLEIPQNAAFYKEPEILPDNEKYAGMTPKEAAAAFFAACKDENWDEVLKFQMTDRVEEGLKSYLGGLEVVSIGEPFRSKNYPGWFVPYEIRLKDGYIKKHNLALRNDNRAKRWVFDGGI